MSRPLRIEYPGAVYHITSRGNEKKPVFKDDTDRQNFLNTIQHVKKRYNWICHAYCLMTNHYHILVETPEDRPSLPGQVQGHSHPEGQPPSGGLPVRRSESRTRKDGRAA